MKKHFTIILFIVTAKSATQKYTLLEQNSNISLCIRFLVYSISHDLYLNTMQLNTTKTCLYVIDSILVYMIKLPVFVSQ